MEKLKQQHEALWKGIEAKYFDLNKQIINFKDEIGTLETANEDLEARIEELQEELYAVAPDQVIDFGYGQLRYRQPDNLKVRQFMDELKQQYHGHVLA